MIFYTSGRWIHAVLQAFHFFVAALFARFKISPLADDGSNRTKQALIIYIGTAPKSTFAPITFVVHPYNHKQPSFLSIKA